MSSSRTNSNNSLRLARSRSRTAGPTTSGSSSRRSSLTRSKPHPQRVIYTIGLEQSVDTTTNTITQTSQATLDLTELDKSLSRLAGEPETDTKFSTIEKANKKPQLPKLSSLRIAEPSTTAAAAANNNKPQTETTTNHYIDIPFVKASLDATLPHYYLKQDILNLITILRIPKWYTKTTTTTTATWDLDTLKLTQISGAMTNAIFKVSYPKLPSLLLRIYGTQNDSIIDRDYELQVLARLSLRNIGPLLYGCFSNGRFEQYLENARTLTAEDIRDPMTSRRIARRMKELHSGVPLLKSEIDNGALCWRKIDLWLGIIERARTKWAFEGDSENVRRCVLARDWMQFKEVIGKYKAWLFSSMKNDLVFCHNDAQYGNLLFSSPLVASGTEQQPDSSVNVPLEDIINPSRQEQSEDSKLVVIDFEYSGPNPAAYDLANHMSEWMHNYNAADPHKCNVKKFPTKEQMLNFLYAYVSHLQGADGRRSDVIEREVKRYYNAILSWRPTVQLFWSLWGILQSGVLVPKPTGDGTTMAEEGPNGEVYIIKSEDTQSVGKNDDDTGTEVESSDEDKDGEEGVSIDTFDYLRYCREKIGLFWTDLIGLGIIDKSECLASDELTYLDTTMM